MISVFTSLLLACLAVAVSALIVVWTCDCGFIPLRKFAAFVRRPMVEIVLVAAIAFGFIRHGATKGTNGLDENGELRIENGEMGGGMRGLPPELAAMSNAFVVTDFAVDTSNKTVVFETTWTNTLFDYTDSRNLFLFSSTNLLEGRWTPLGAFLMPSDTNSCVFAVTTNDVDAAALPRFLDSLNGIGFYRFGVDVDTDGDGLVDSYETLWTFTDPDVLDTDGDGLTDGQELSPEIGTDPLLYDTDGDGLSDGEEVAVGTSPFFPDTDGDGILDLAESGSVTVLPSFEWHDTDGFPAVYGTSLAGMWGYFGNSASAAFSAPVCLNGIECSSVMAFENGYVSVLASGDYNAWVFPEMPMPLWSHAYNSGTFLVAPYWSGLFLPYGDTNACLRIGHDSFASVTVVEFHDVRTGFTSEYGMTFQVVIPDGTGNVVRVSYLDSDVWMDGYGAVVGVQDKSHSSSNGYSHLTWNFSARGPILPGSTIEYRLGTGTNPVSSDSDEDGIDDAYELNEYGTDPWYPDTDDDGLTDGVEVQMGTAPLSADTDEDGLTDGAEVQCGTFPLSADTDNDGLSDGWEVATGLDPLSGEGIDGASGDSDFDGLTNLQELNLGTDPCDSDTDGDNLSDGWEVSHGLDPLSAADGDPDCDGLPNAQEIAIGTDPFQPDSDGDGMNDGWEYEHRSAGFDPTIDNATDSNPGNDIDADPDGDGLTNGQECEWRTDPMFADTDGDGVNDGTEIAQNSDPADASDGGNPNSRIPVSFYFGDPSGSHSEKYRLEVEPVSGQGDMPKAFSWLNEDYGECETKTAMLKNGWKYKVRLYHAGTMLNGDPDYDYTLVPETNGLPPNVVVSDPNGLFGSDETSTSFAGEGKVATITLYKVMVEEIKFNHSTGSSTQDAVSIRKNAREPFDLEHGEWWIGGTELKNDPVCYVGGSEPTVKAKISVSPAIPSARLFAAAVGNNSPLGGLSAQTVAFSGGVSGWTDFCLDAMVARTVRRADHRWEWKVSHVDGAAVTAFVCATTGPHRVYTIMDTPVAPWVANGEDVQNPWSDALELACTVADGKSDKGNALASLASYLFNSHGVVYDSKHGMPSFLHDDGAFDMTGYLTKRSPNGNLVNCFDQGHAVKVLGNVIGISVEVKIIRPFGYLEGAYLVGQGFCNNPFYENNYYSHLKLCPRNDPARSPFSCHCFAMYDGQVFDACVGPVTGNLSLQQYIDSNIDSQTILSNPRAGTLTDVTDCHIMTMIK